MRKQLKFWNQDTWLRRQMMYDWFYVFPFIYVDDKVTVLESEKRAWESSPEAQAIKEALNPWRKHDEDAQKKT
jgi:predicted Zn-dependent protease